MIYAYFGNIIVPEDNGMDRSCTKNFQKNVAFSYIYNLVCADDKFRVKMLFTLLLIVSLQKANYLVM